jgi:branched-chain amino acid transport system permease protein
VTKFLQFLFTGLSTGAIYALIALGFVIIYKASEVINFAQGALLAFGAFVVWWLVVHTGWLSWAGSNRAVVFLIACVISIIITSALGLLVERTVLRRMVGQPIFAIAIITIGLDAVIRTVVDSRTPIGTNAIGSPIQGRTVTFSSATVSHADIYTIIVTAIVVVAFFAFFKFSKFGLAIRATAVDQEAALAMGISVRQVFAITWGIAGALAVVGAVLQLSRTAQGLDPSTGFIGLRAFPAAILGGLDSAGGAVIGGAVIGLVEGYFQFYQPHFLGNNFHLVAPYAVMVLVLLVRPYGLFGTKTVERV